MLHESWGFPVWLVGTGIILGPVWAPETVLSDPFRWALSLASGSFLILVRTQLNTQGGHIVYLWSSFSGPLSPSWYSILCPPAALLFLDSDPSPQLRKSTGLHLREGKREHPRIWGSCGRSNFATTVPAIILHGPEMVLEAGSKHPDLDSVCLHSSNPSQRPLQEKSL